MQGRRSPPRGRGRSLHDGVTRILSVAMIVLGVLLMTHGALLALVLGVAMIGAGAGRLWVVAQERRPPR